MTLQSHKPAAAAQLYKPCDAARFASPKTQHDYRAERSSTSPFPRPLAPNRES